VYGHGDMVGLIMGNIHRIIITVPKTEMLFTANIENYGIMTETSKDFLTVHQGFSLILFNDLMLLQFNLKRCNVPQIFDSKSSKNTSAVSSTIPTTNKQGEHHEPHIPLNF
jgi:hypothetical protein